MKKITIKPNQRYGKLVTTGRTRRTRRGGRLYIEIELSCPHGVKKFRSASNIRSGETASCRLWKECYTPPAGTTFGSLTATGKIDKGKKGPRAEVMCSHGVKKFIHIFTLENGNTKGCRGWEECFIPPAGTKFGSLTTTGKTRKNTHGATEIEVKCSHGVKKFRGPTALKTGNATSCRLWKECCIPPPGTELGSLTTTGRSRSGKRATELEVACPHNVRKFLDIRNLKSGNTTSCLQWKECSIPPAGTKFGSLTTTGRTRKGEQGTEAEVICSHGIKKFALVDRLKSGRTKSCRLWKECGLTKGERSHYWYLRQRTPSSAKAHEMEHWQVGICCLCGNVASDKPLNSREHKIPVASFARGKGSLKSKNARCNAVTNIFGAHLRCNDRRSDMSLSEWFRLHPEYKKPAMLTMRRLQHRRRRQKFARTEKFTWCRR